MLAHLRALLSSRRFSILVLAAILGGTAGLLLLGRAMSEQFASQIEGALAAQARHSVRELAAIATLGVASNDAERFNAAIDDYMTEPGIEMLAIEVDGKILVSRGAGADVHALFQVPPNMLVRGPGYVACWAPGTLGNKIAVLISTTDIDALDALQTKIAYGIVAAGAAAALGFAWGRRRARGPRRIAATLPGGGAAPEPDAQPILQQLLAHASEGVVIVELAGQLVRGYSSPVERWFGAPAPEATLASYLGARNAALAVQLRRLDGDALAQLPARITIDDRTFDARYAPVPQDAPSRLLVFLDDVTERLAREVVEREARDQREVAALAALMTANRAEFDEIFAEIAKLVASLDTPSDVDTELAALRTLKDSCTDYGVESYVELCAAIETSLRATSAPMTAAQRGAVSDRWSQISSRLMRIAAAGR